MSAFATHIMHDKYSHTKKDGELENWSNIAYRVSKHVMKAVDASKTLTEAIREAIEQRKFIPGGRYLYSTGRPYHQVQNCVLLRAEDSREGWSEHLHNSCLSLMTGAGMGAEYSRVREGGRQVRKTGGTASGPLPLMSATNEVGRAIRNGGNRRCAIWAGLDWQHGDIFKFITIKNWIPEVKNLKLKDFSFPATLDMTNISVGLDDDFFAAYGDLKHSQHNHAHAVYWAVIRQMMETGEPGFSINIGDNRKEVLRNACLPEWATVLTPDGTQTLKQISIGSTIWSGKQWTKVTNKVCTGTKPVFGFGTRAGVFYGTADHHVISEGGRIEAQEADTIDTTVGPVADKNTLLNQQDIVDGLMIGDGTVHKASNNLVLLVIGAKDGDYHTSEIAHLIGRHRPGVSESDWEITTTIIHQELPKTYSREVPPRFRFGSHRTVRGFLRGLFTANGSIAGNRVTLKASSLAVILAVQEMLSSIGIRSYYTINVSKKVEFSNGEYTCKESYDLNITADRIKFRELIGFIQKYKVEKLNEVCEAALGARTKPPKSSYEVVEVWSEGVQEVFDITVEAEEHTFWTGGMLVSNCTEITSADDSDICNLGSINLSRVASLDEMEKLVELGTAFLLAGTVYSDVPYPKIDLVRTKNRRLGLGLMGIHEWLLKHQFRYGSNPELFKYLEVYQHSDKYAKQYAKKWDMSVPVKTRAIAPNGTIGICSETSTGLEPVFCAAYKRRYRKGESWAYEYVVDPTAKRLVAEGINPDKIEDAYSLAEDIERRVSFQADVQGFVDHGISSTINLPRWGSELNNENTVQKFGDMLIKYLPRLRGITVYPDGARGGQPLNAVPFELAVKHEGEVVYESADVCEITRGGDCG